MVFSKRETLSACASWGAASCHSHAAGRQKSLSPSLHCPPTHPVQHHHHPAAIAAGGVPQARSWRLPAHSTAHSLDGSTVSPACHGLTGHILDAFSCLYVTQVPSCLWLRRLRRLWRRRIITTTPAVAIAAAALPVAVAALAVAVAIAIAIAPGQLL